MSILSWSVSPYALVTMGLVSFCAAAQFAPLITC